MMNLQTEQIRAMTLGADRVTEEKDGLCFHRFTEEQEAFGGGRDRGFCGSVRPRRGTKDRAGLLPATAGLHTVQP